MSWEGRRQVGRATGSIQVPQHGAGAIKYWTQWMEDPGDQGGAEQENGKNRSRCFQKHSGVQPLESRAPETMGREDALVRQVL